MINSKEEDDFLNDHDYIKTIQSKRRFLNYGVSEFKDAEDKTLHYKQLYNKSIQSQEKIQDELYFIQTIANNNNPPKIEKGALLDVKYPNNKRNARRRGINNLCFLIKI